MSVVPITCFSAGSNSIPLPSGPLLQLPGGSLGVCNHGRVFAHAKWVIAVGVAPDLFLVLGNFARRNVPLTVCEQLVGYLTACGAEVVRLRIRFPLWWHNPGELRRTTEYWTREFLSGLSIALEPQLGATRPQIILPVGVLARQAGLEWSLVIRISRALEEEHPGAFPQFQSLLWDISRRWEIRWNLVLRDAERRQVISRMERADIERCDRAWIPLFRRYLEPHGYELLPPTLVRLI